MTRHEGNTAHAARWTRNLIHLRQRGQSLCRGGWDINALRVLADDARTIARELGRTEQAGTLYALGDILKACLDPPSLPDATMTQRIGQLLETATRTSPATDASPAIGTGERAAAADSVLDDAILADAALGDALLDDATPDDATLADAPAAAVEPTTAPSIGSMPAPTEAGAAPAATGQPAADSAPPPIEPLSIVYLGTDGALALELDRRLRAAGAVFERVEHPTALAARIAARPVDLAVVEAADAAALGEVGPLARRAREDGSPMRLVALIESDGFDERLRALRAGCDSVLDRSTDAAQLHARLLDLADDVRGAPFRVLIVEDDRPQAMFADALLRKRGMLTHIALTPNEALEAIDAFAPDLILMDLHMPECSGAELTALIRQRDAFLATPIVFLSGEQDADLRFEALLAGGDDFLSKPIRPQHLIDAVGSRVRRARRISRRQATVASARAAAQRLRDPVQLEHRLAELLAVEDATDRAGGVLVVGIHEAAQLRERYGATELEHALAELGARLADALPQEWIAAYGGEGYLLLDSARDDEALVALAQSLREHVARAPVTIGGQARTLGAAVGICRFHGHRGDAASMLANAAQALTSARKERTGGVAVYAVARVERVSPALIAVVRDALEQTRLDVVFQPIVSLLGEDEQQFQALLRVTDAGGRVYSASELVPAAEQAGLIDRVDRQILARCIALLAAQVRGGQVPRLFVSQSIASVSDAQRVDWLRAQLGAANLAPDRLVLELRAADAAAGGDAVTAFALAIRELGAGLALSGFESNPALDALLQRLPLDFVKLSPRYTSTQREELRGELAAIVERAHGGGMRVIAPRVEEARTAAALWSAGVDLIQGNLVQQVGHDLSYDFHASGL